MYFTKKVQFNETKTFVLCIKISANMKSAGPNSKICGTFLVDFKAL